MQAAEPRYTPNLQELAIDYGMHPAKAEVLYTGHGVKGALQMHSVGELYPYTIVGTCHNAGPTRYYWQNLLTGQRGEEKHTYNLAEIDLHSRKLYAFMNA